MSESGHEHLLNHLRDVHALEFHAQRQLSRLADRADDDDLREICCQHLEQTQQHEQRMSELVKAQGREPSPLEDKTFRGGAIGLRQLADIAPDTPPRVAIQLFGLEHLEMAACELLEQIADREDEQDVVNTAREILEQKREAAEKVRERFDRAAELFVEQRGGPDSDDDRHSPLLLQLTELHALEEQSLQLLHIAARDVCQDDEVEQLLTECREQSHEHEREVTQRIEAHHAHPSAVKDLHMGTARSGLRDLASHPPDAYVKLAMNLCCLLHVLAAAYEVLGKVAELSDDGQSAELARKLAEQKREVAEQVRDKFPYAIELMYSSDGTYEASRRGEAGQSQQEPSHTGG